MFSSPFTEIGRLQQEVRDLEQKLHNKPDNWELIDIKSRLSHLESVIISIQNSIGHIEQTTINLKTSTYSES